MNSSSSETFDLRTQLQSEFVERCRKNPQYSLRAFARTLGIGSSVLSKILNGKRSITPAMCKRLGDALGYDEKMLRKAMESHSKKSAKTVQANYRKLSQTVFSIISDWYHNAIIEMAKLDDFQHDPSAIAKRLGITERQASRALQRLSHVGLLRAIDGGSLAVSSEANSNVGALAPVTSPSLRKLQRQVLERALLALRETPIERRSQTSMTMAIDLSLLPKARDLITKFRRTLCDELQSSSRLTEVYQLSVSLYPLTKSFEGDIQ